MAVAESKAGAQQQQLLEAEAWSLAVELAVKYPNPICSLAQSSLKSGQFETCSVHQCPRHMLMMTSGGCRKPLTRPLQLALRYLSQWFVFVHDILHAPPLDIHFGCLAKHVYRIGINPLLREQQADNLLLSSSHGMKKRCSAVTIP